MEPRLLFSVISDTFPRDIVVCIRFKYLAVIIVLGDTSRKRTISNKNIMKKQKKTVAKLWQW